MGQNDPYGQQQYGNQQYGGPPQQPQYGQQQPPAGYPGQQPPQYGQQYPPQYGYGGPPQYAQPPRRSTCLRNAIIGGLVLIVLCGVGGYLLFMRGKAEIEAATRAIDSFMQAGKNNDTGVGAALSTVSEAEIAELFGNRQLFDGYESISVSGFSLNSSSGQQTRIELNGTVKYSSGPDGTYEARLLSAGDGWVLDRIQIRRSP